MKPAEPLVQWLADAEAPVSLLCFHCAGGSAQSFFAWKQAAAGVCELYAVELPGRSRRLREPFAHSVTEVAAAFAEQCQALPDKPLVLFGHSLGALLAYETAQVLLAQGCASPCTCWCLLARARTGCPCALACQHSMTRPCAITWRTLPARHGRCWQTRR
ncbi:alpha/beta fold hydrolase [Pseudomonas qingdaonensis]|nr:alpha/beta fold hydrolase [Pseudomonas qingdaonensis]